MRHARRLLVVGLSVASASLVGPFVHGASATTLTGVDLSTYVRVGRHDLPEPTRTAAPAGSLLAQEASGVTYDWDTGTLFVVGDGGTSVVQVSKTGQLIDSMTLAAGSSSAATTFYDTEGITYVGGGRFVMTEERDRQLVRFTYAAGTTLTRADAQTVKLGTTIGNVGLEGVSNDPTSGGLLVVKEKTPESIFQTTVDWAAGTATNGSPTAAEATDLFPPANVGTSDFSDVFALSNLTTLTGPDASNLVIISQEAGRVVELDRSGTIKSTLTITGDADNPLSVPDQTDEGVTMDPDGNLYIVNEQGGGDGNHPQLWVYSPSTAPNQAPTGITLTHQTASIAENTSTATRVKVADVTVADDGIGTNTLAVTGPDASHFEVDSTGLYLKAGTTLSHSAQASYTVAVTVDDPSVGSTPDATSSDYTLTVSAVAGANPARSIVVTEVSPWSSSASSYAADWFEVTNNGTQTVDLTGWKVDDDSNTATSAIALNGVAALKPGRSAVFIEGTASTTEAFKTAWFGSSVPAGFLMGYYEGSGIGLSSSGDQVNLFDSTGTHVTGVAFGASTTGKTFDNTAGLGAATGPVPVISTLSAAGTNGAVTVGSETGSPGTAPVATSLAVTEVAPWGSSDTTYAADWWELTNLGSTTVDLTGFKIDDSSNAFATAVPMTGVASLAPGQSAIFVEGDATTATKFTSAWFGSSVPAGFQIGSYSGQGVGLSAGGDGVNVFNADGDRVTGVSFGASTNNVSFDNAVGAGSFSVPVPTISTLSVVGTHGAFNAHDEIGSPGTIVQPAPIGPRLGATVPTFPSQPVGTTGPGQWITATNTGDADVTISRVAIHETDDDSAGDFLLSADRCTDVTLAPGATCRVQVRFAPGRQNATSSATLAFSANVTGGTTTVALSGTSAGLPTGATGAAGPAGATGAAG
ncbi:MAG: SdiA-regulated domain-containing protein, partial [Solirubrobacteraceae bacterium]|nr:SdiA-regulated domain-containing protein [Patulibacter sp.]